jgi:hypothetical protein
MWSSPDVFTPAMSTTGCSPSGTNGASGAIVWTAEYDGSGSGNDGAAAVAIDAAGDVIVTGYSVDQAGGRNMRTVKYAGATGARIWASAFDADGSARANAIALNGAGDVFVTGESEDPGRNIRTVKYDGASGAQLWTASLNGSFTSGFDIGEAIAVDAGGDVFVTGVSGENAGGSNFRTVKYDGATGELRWTRQFGVSGDDSGLAGLVAPDGSFVAAGYTYETGQGSR